MSVLLTNQELKLQAEIIKELHLLKLPDANRISAEIVKFTQADRERFNEILIRLKAGEPWEYIKGTAEFCGLNFRVTHDVLIPRIETELLVDRAYDECMHFIKSGVGQIQLVDLGTGSGAIIISLAHKLCEYNHRVSFTAADISLKALEVAQENRTNLLDRNYITFHESDLLSAISLDSSLPTLICANLPYITDSAYPTLDTSVHDYEPALALKAGVDGLDLYRKLWSQINECGFKNLTLIAEMDPEQIQSYLELTADSFNEIIKDQFGVERFVLSLSHQP